MADLDVGLEDIPSQIATAILSIHDGGILKVSGEFSSEDHSLTILYKIMKDAVKTLNGQEPLSRVSIALGDFNYVMTVSGKCVYIAKVRA
jgi:hypothetical protein